MVVNTQEGGDHHLPRTRGSARGKTHTVTNEGKDDHQSIIVESMCISEASLHFRRPAPTWSMRRGSHRQSKSKDTG